MTIFTRSPSGSGSRIKSISKSIALQDAVAELFVDQLLKGSAIDVD